MPKELYKAYYRNTTFNFIWADDWIDAVFLIMADDQLFLIDDLIKLELASKEEKEKIKNEQ